MEIHRNITGQPPLGVRLIVQHEHGANASRKQQGACFGVSTSVPIPMEAPPMLFTNIFYLRKDPIQGNIW